MATKFKEIVDNKGYKLTLSDRTIFERSVSKSLFGLDSTLPNQHNTTDVIEFVLFDSNDNQLPQGDSGAMTRYIYLDDVNIKEYITISIVTDDNHTNSNKYEINSERLIKEAGYSNGIYNVQITLLNRRIGSDVNTEDKLWIHEISPSRTEIRVVPVKGDEDNITLGDLQERYDIFLNGGQFRDDVIHYIHEFIEHIDVTKVLLNMFSSIGKHSDGKKYINVIKQEFQITDFEDFLRRIRAKYTEAMIYYATNCQYNVKSLDYGKPLSGDVKVSLAVSDLYETAMDIIASIVDDVLPHREIIKDSVFIEETDVTLDELKQIEEIKSGRKTFNPSGEEIKTPIEKIKHGLPPREDPPIKPIKEIPIPDKPITQIFYVWSDEGTVTYLDENNEPVVTAGVEYDKLKITYLGKPKFKGDIREIQKMELSARVCTDPRATNFGEVGKCVYKKIDVIEKKIKYDDIILYEKPKKPLTLDEVEHKLPPRGDIRIKPPIEEKILVSLTDAIVLKKTTSKQTNTSTKSTEITTKTTTDTGLEKSNQLYL